jgi:hypothetical protein
VLKIFTAKQRAVEQESKRFCGRRRAEAVFITPATLPCKKGQRVTHPRKKTFRNFLAVQRSAKGCELNQESPDQVPLLLFHSPPLPFSQPLILSNHGGCGCPCRTRKPNSLFNKAKRRWLTAKRPKSGLERTKRRGGGDNRPEIKCL